MAEVGFGGDCSRLMKILLVSLCLVSPSCFAEAVLNAQTDRILTHLVQVVVDPKTGTRINIYPITESLVENVILVTSFSPIARNTVDQLEQNAVQLFTKDRSCFDVWEEDQAKPEPSAVLPHQAFVYRNLGQPDVKGQEPRPLPDPDDNTSDMLVSTTLGTTIALWQAAHPANGYHVTGGIRFCGDPIDFSKPFSADVFIPPNSPHTFTWSPRAAPSE